MSFGMSFDERMESYYQRFIDLQEKLRKSEEDRLKLEMKFNEMLQISREEERSHYRRLRSQYKRFLDEDRKRQERNEKIMRALERIESRISLLSSKTERFKYLRRQYKTYLQRVNHQAPHSQHIEENNHPEGSYNPLELKSAIKKSNEEKLEILEKYLTSLNSHKRERYETGAPKAPNYEEDLKKLDMFSKNLKDGFDSNKANSIAEEIMNSIHSRHYKKEDCLKTLKPKYSVYEDNSDYDGDRDNNHIVRHDQGQTQSDKGPKDTFLKTLSSDKKHVRIEETDYGIQKIIYDHAENEHQDLLGNKNDDRVEENHLRDVDSVDEAQQEAKRVNTSLENAYAEATGYEVLNGHEIQELGAVKATSYSNIPKIHTMNLKQSEATNEEISDTENSKQVKGHNDTADKLSYARNEESVPREVETVIQKLEHYTNLKNGEENSSGKAVSQVEWSHKDDDSIKEEHEANKSEEQQGRMESQQSEVRIDNRQNGEGNDIEINQEQQTSQFIEAAGQSQTVNSNKQCDRSGQLDDKNQLTQQYTKSSNDQRYDESELQYDINDQSAAQHGENSQLQQHKADALTVQQYVSNQLQYGENGQPIQKYDEYGKMTEQYQECDPNAQQYTDGELQYDDNGQLIAQYNGNGQLVPQYQEGDPKDQQYAEGQLKYDENGQVVPQYDENGQLIQQYEEGDPNAGQYAEGQYDENGQPIAQYDENGQLIQQYQEGDPNVEQYAGGQYDENGQPIAQYDEHGQFIQQYQEGDPNAGQYAEGQYDKNGQPIPQYDGNGELIQQYPEGDTNAGQYAEGQYDENGQLIAQYGENGELIQQYQEGDPSAGQYAEGQYDENGQLIAQYDENGELIQQYQEGGPSAKQYAASQLQYDENGQPIPQYDENGQLIQQYLEDTQYQIQYDENGQPIGQYTPQYDPNAQYYDENGQAVNYSETAQLYDENGQLVQKYDENSHQLAQKYEENLAESVPEDEGQAFSEKVGTEAMPHTKVETKEESKEFNVLELLETDTDVSVKENTSKITNDSDFDFSNA